MSTTRMSHSQRHLQLLDIAEELFTTNGYEQVSIEDIAREAGVTRAVVYQQNGSKEELFLNCVRRARNELEASLAAAEASAGGDLTEFVEAGALLLFNLLNDTPSRWALIFSSSVGESGHLATELTKLRFGTIDRLAAMAATYAPGLDEEHVQAFAVAVSGIVEAFGRWWLYSPGMDPERLLMYFRDFITSAIAAALDQANKP